MRTATPIRRREVPRQPGKLVIVTEAKLCAECGRWIPANHEALNLEGTRVLLHVGCGELVAGPRGG